MACSAARRACSIRLTSIGQRLSLVWILGHAPGDGELHAQRATEQSEQPERGSAEVPQLRGRQQDRASTNNRLSLSTAVFRTDNENVILHGRRAPPIPPIFNQDDAPARQRIHHRIARADHATVAGDRQLRVSRHQANQPEPAEQRQAPALTPEFSGSLWTTYAFPAGSHARRRPALHGRGVRERGQHDPRSRITGSPMPWRSTTSTATFRCG